MKHKSYYIVVSSIIISVIVFSRCFDNGFREDDFSFLRHIITNPPLKAIFVPSQSFSFYRPGAISLFYLEFKLFHLNSGLYLVFNYVLHLLISIVYMKVLLAMRFDRWIAALAASIFILGVGHYGKQIMWACTSGPLFAVLLTLISLLILLRWLGNSIPANGSDHHNSARSHLLILLLLLISPLFHGLALFTPVLLLVTIWVYPGERRSRVVSMVPFIVVPPVIWLILLALLSKAYASYGNVPAQLLGSPAYLIRYLGFMLFPVQESQLVAGTGLGFLWPLIRLDPYLHIMIGALILLIILLILLKGKNNLRILAVWLPIAIIPFTFIQMPQSWLELRYIYYASIPLCGLLAHAMIHFGIRQNKALRAAAISILLVACACSVILITLLANKYDEMSKHPQNKARLEAIRESLSSRINRSMSFEAATPGVQDT